MHGPSYPLTHPPYMLVSPHEVIPMQLAPLVVQLLDIKLHKSFVGQLILPHDVYGKQAPFVPSILVYPVIQRQGPSVP
jgi:hypothetical protein